MKKNKRAVVKIGTKVLMSPDGSLDLERVKDIVRQISEIKKKNIDVILVTSGAIGSGLSLLKMKKRPTDLATLQAAAAIGQNSLMHSYSQLFRGFGINAGQMLLTQEDFNDRKRYLNIKHTIERLLDYGAVPVINENDTVATDEIRCGDNDRLSSLVADLSQAAVLVILTDVDGLMDDKGNVVCLVGEITPNLKKMCQKASGHLGTGGMITKIEAAKSATRAGIECVIANGMKKNILTGIILEGKADGTVFKCASHKYLARKRWIAFSSQPKGSVMVDDGAVTAVSHKNKSLLASGILGVKGNFDSGDVIGITDNTGREFARGLTNYSSSALEKIKGRRTQDFKKILGSEGRDEVIHKDNLVII